jgi:hypothetical protein
LSANLKKNRTHSEGPGFLEIIHNPDGSLLAFPCAEKAVLVVDIMLGRVTATLTETPTIDVVIAAWGDCGERNKMSSGVERPCEPVPELLPPAIW